MKTTFQKIQWTEVNKTFAVVADINVNLLLNLEEFEQMIREYLNLEPEIEIKMDDVKTQLIDYVFRINDLTLI